MKFRFLSGLYNEKLADWLLSSSSCHSFENEVKSNSCREGYLEFRDYGFNAEGGQVLRYCNGDSPSFAPPEFKSLGNTAQILLRNTMDQNASFAMTVSYQKLLYFSRNRIN